MHVILERVQHHQHEVLNPGSHGIHLVNNNSSAVLLLTGVTAALTGTCWARQQLTLLATRYSSRPTAAAAAAAMVAAVVTEVQTAGDFRHSCSSGLIGYGTFQAGCNTGW